MKLFCLHRSAASALAAACALLSCAVAALTQNQSAPVPPGQDRVYDELAKVPEKARSRPNPLENDPDAPAAGKKLFEDHCAECHGADASGGKKGPSLRAAEVQQSPPGAIFWILTNGVVRHGMPVWSKLPEPQRWELVAYLKSLGNIPEQGAAPLAH